MSIFPNMKIWKKFQIPLAHTVFWFRVASNNINTQYGLFQAHFCLVKVGWDAMELFLMRQTLVLTLILHWTYAPQVSFKGS